MSDELNIRDGWTCADEQRIAELESALAASKAKLDDARAELKTAAEHIYQWARRCDAIQEGCERQEEVVEAARHWANATDGDYPETLALLAALRALDGSLKGGA